MSVSTFQKITFLSCLVLCVSLFLPKILFSTGKKDIVQSKVKVSSGHAPPLRYSQLFLDDDVRWQTEMENTRPYNPELVSKVTGSGKPPLLGQVIPVYGFGIFLYIIYIFFKLTHKDTPPRKQECTVPILPPETTIQATPDSEKALLQARLMEGVRRKRASKSLLLPNRAQRPSLQREERKITCVMLDGWPLEGVSPEMEAEETPYTLGWEGYSEETFPRVSFCGRHRYPSIILEEPDIDAPTAEQLAERIEEEKYDSEDDGEEEEEEVKKDKEMTKNRLGEDKVDATENSPIQLKGDDDDDDDDDDKTEQEEEQEEESCEPDYEEDEQPETEERRAKMVEVELEGDDDDGLADIEQEEEEEYKEEEVREEQPCLPHTVGEEEGGNSLVGRKDKKRITFSDHKHIFHYLQGSFTGCEHDEGVQECANENDTEDDVIDEEEEGEDDDDDDDDDDLEEEDNQDEEQKEVLGKEEDDPLMEAESLGFSAEVEWAPEEQDIDLVDFLLTYQPHSSITRNQPAPASPEDPSSGILRMCHKQ